MYNEAMTPENQDGNINLITPNVQMCFTHQLLKSTPDISPVSQVNNPRALVFGSLYSDALTPTFGIHPLNTSTPNNEAISPINGTQNALTEANDQKSLAKRVRQHVGQLMSRRDGPLQMSKPVLSPSSNIAVSTPVTGNVPSVRRSSRLFSNSNSVKENNKSPNRDKFVTPKSPSRKTKQRLAKANLNKTTFSEMNVRNLQNAPEIDKPETITANLTVPETNKTVINNNLNTTNEAINVQKYFAEGLMELFRNLGQAYQHLSHFNCRKAIELLLMLPPQHYNTSWVLSMLGVAHFELNEFGDAVSYFKEVHEREPYRFDFMEIYSTALWHLQKEVELSALAQNLQSLDKNNPITWCVAGNYHKYYFLTSFL